MALDPRTKWKLHKILPLDSVIALRRDEKQAGFQIATQQAQNNLCIDVDQGENEHQPQGDCRRCNKGSASFFGDHSNSDSDDKDNNVAESNGALINNEFQAYKLDKGCSMFNEIGYALWNGGNRSLKISHDLETCSLYFGNFCHFCSS